MKNSDDERKRLVMETIINKVEVHQERWATDPFVVLVGTIISQNTNDRNTDKALRLLRKDVGLDPDSILSASKEKIIECLKPAGLYNVKAPRIIKLAKIIKKELGDPRELNKMDKKDVSDFLSKIGGIGPKTIDIFFAFSRNEDVIPVDTHIKRVARRLGLAREKDNYYQIRENLERLVSMRDRVRAHFSLITFGREICHARKPKCPKCPVAKYCPSKKIFYPNL